MSCALAVLASLLTLGGSDSSLVGIEGDYIESRTADVYTGPCFSNAEVFLTGHQGLMAWQIRRGSWEGVDLAGLTVAAAVRGTTTLGLDNVDKALGVVIVDARANEAQREALISFAKSKAGGRLDQIQAVKTASMILTVEAGMDESAEHEVASAHHAGPMAPRACFWAEGLAEINTRPMEPTDHVCGNEVLAYAPLAKGVSVQPAYTITNIFRGDGLNTKWEDRNCRGSYVGRFAY